MVILYENDEVFLYFKCFCYVIAFPNEIQYKP